MNEDRLPRAFYELHSGLPREGPGDTKSTRRALAMLPALPPGAVILDVGCGPGFQTLDLARSSSARIFALDCHIPYLQELGRRAAKAGLSGRIFPLAGDMRRLPFPEGRFDLIWSEGAIYNMGFENGLRTWRKFLKPGGYITVSDAVWLRPDPPARVRKFWEEYPGMTSIEGSIARVRTAGYEMLGHFSLPKSAWWDDYYNPLSRRIDDLSERMSDDPTGREILALHRREIALFRDHSDCYGYEFFVVRFPASPRRRPGDRGGKEPAGGRRRNPDPGFPVKY